jgi:hypothetical protein
MRQVMKPILRMLHIPKDCGYISFDTRARIVDGTEEIGLIFDGRKLIAEQDRSGKIVGLLLQ